MSIVQNIADGNYSAAEKELYDNLSECSQGYTDIIEGYISDNMTVKSLDESFSRSETDEQILTIEKAIRMIDEQLSETSGMDEEAVAKLMAERENLKSQLEDVSVGE